MAFPTTDLLDDFSGTLGSWTNSQFGDGALTIISGTVCGVVTPNWGGAVWTAGFNADCEAYVDINTLGSSGHNFSIWARCTGSGGSPTGYALGIGKAATDTWSLDRLVAGVAVNIDSGTFTLGAGDALGIQAVGTAISAWRKPSGGSWAELGSGTNGDIVAAGKIGLEVYGQVWRLDNFSGGSSVPGQMLLPDADLAAGGWTTEPLFSKLNDSSDATYISATAS